jgi:hypothetical protein
MKQENLFRMAPFPSRDHSSVHSMVSSLCFKLPRSRGNDARARASGGSHHDLSAFVQHYAPELDKRCRQHLNACNDTWRVDETYIKIKKTGPISTGRSIEPRKHDRVLFESNA